MPPPIRALAVDRYVRIPLFCIVTGYTEEAVQTKIKKGTWREGKHYKRAPDGHLLIDMWGFHSWVENPTAAV